MQAVASRSACRAPIATPSTGRKIRLQPCRAAEQQQQDAPSTSGSAAPPPPASGAQAQAPASGRVVREYRALGSRVVEADGRLTGPEDQPDFWEGERFDSFGKALETYFLPALVALGVVIGGFAARSYSGPEGASAFIKPPTSPDDEMAVIDAATVESVLGGGAAAAPSILAE